MGKYISDLPAKTPLVGSELIEIQDGAGSGSSKHATVQDVANLFEPAYPVSSVNGQTGAVALTADNVPEATPTPTNKYYTTKRNAQSPVNALAIVAGVVTIDCSLGSYFTLLLNANVTSIVFANLPAAGIGQTIAIRMQQDATGNRTVALPSAFKATTGSLSSPVATAALYTLLMATTFDQGTRWEYTMQGVAS